MAYDVCWTVGGGLEVALVTCITPPSPKPSTLKFLKVEVSKYQPP